ncbi:hypothetical protein [Salinicola acroporae]|uniref:hypothetical protein n=1 Tax=Salinicola acroporae TaxID=1541440 RepID=UPI002458D577|nr:hypothetical protein [Salinicola acroporae]
MPPSPPVESEQASRPSPTQLFKLIIPSALGILVFFVPSRSMTGAPFCSTTLSPVCVH